jgi:hypothetical protein
MGASEDFRTYPKKDGWGGSVRTRSDIEKLFAYDQEQSAHEDGNSYSGQIGVMPIGISWVNETFESYNEAENYILENHEKWDEAMGTEFPDGFLVGGWCSS